MRFFRWIGQTLGVVFGLPAFLALLSLTESPGWATLKQIVSTKWIASSFAWLFIVPVVAKGMSGLDDPLEITFSDWQLTVPLTLPFSWLAFYFGACFFALGLAFYAVACPLLIRDYKTYSQFKDEGRGMDLLWSEHQTNTFYRRNIRPILEPHCLDSAVVTKDFLTRYCTGDWEGQLPRLEPLVAKLVSAAEAVGGALADRPLQDPYGDIEGYDESWLQAYEELRKACSEWTRHDLFRLNVSWLDTENQMQAQAFWDIRNAGDDSSPVLRWIVMRAVLVGYLLHGWVAIQGFWYVLSYTLA